MEALQLRPVLVWIWTNTSHPPRGLCSNE